MIAGFEFGCRAPLHVRRERVRCRVANGAPWRLLFASDLHLLRSRRHLVRTLAAIAASERIDAVLLGGDLVDRTNALPVLVEAVAALATSAPVVAVPGNHDARCGLAGVAAAVEAGGGRWLPDGDVVLRAAQRSDLHLHATAAPCADGALHVLVGHHPDAAAAQAHGHDVAFAGHLHGGQCVWWQRGTRLFPGAWFSPWTGLRFELGASTLLVSRGVADTLPVRFRCPREVLLCELGGAP